MTDPQQKEDVVQLAEVSVVELNNLKGSRILQALVAGVSLSGEMTVIFSSKFCDFRAPPKEQNSDSSKPKRERMDSLRRD